MNYRATTVEKTHDWEWLDLTPARWRKRCRRCGIAVAYSPDYRDKLRKCRGTEA